MNSTRQGLRPIALSRFFLGLLLLAGAALAQADMSVSASAGGRVDYVGPFALESGTCTDNAPCFFDSSDGGTVSLNAVPDPGFSFAGFVVSGPPGATGDYGSPLTVEFDTGATVTTSAGNSINLAGNTGSGGDSITVQALFSGGPPPVSDSDGDGVTDASDQCPATPAGEAVDSVGCSQSQLDDDEDGVNNTVDQCPATPPGEPVNGLGCSQTQIDDDDDGVNNSIDECPGTPAGEAVDSVGCGQSQLDDDEDGVNNTVDQCPATPPGEPVNGLGCSQTQLDDDEDGVNNAVDQCPATPPGEPVDTVGCSQTQLDDDEDGVNNAVDQCPATPLGEPVDTVGCSQTQLDDDEDGVNNAVDQCPATPPGDPVDSFGCGQTQIDGDEDGVNNASDQCPATPAGENVDAVGCSQTQLDGDEDGVSDAGDLCPSTPPGLPVNTFGCAASERDSDSDTVSDADDQCPATPRGAEVDARGCASSQLDDDSDGVDNATDECPETTAGAEVDSVGCSETQRDSDSDGVDDASDQCLQTPEGEAVDAVGCSQTQLDDDGDGASNAVDQCPLTPAGEAVDATGCSEGQRDDDGDGIPNAEDQCDASGSVLEVDAEGCTEVQNFGQELSSITGLSTKQRGLAARIDEVCPRIIESEALGQPLTSGQRGLRNACSRIKNSNTTPEQALAALDEILPDEIIAFRDYSIELATIQFRQLDSRQKLRRTGGGSGASVAGLSIRTGQGAIPAQALQSAFEGLLGLAAGEGDAPFADFGKLGVYLQGDIDFAKRDQDLFQSGYKFDIWSLTLGADYRLSDRLYAGVALSAGEAEVEYRNNGGTSDIENIALSAYGGWQISDGWYVDGLLSYGSSTYDTLRRIRYVDSGGEFSSDNRSDTDGTQLYIGLNSGYMFNRGGLRFGPTASVFYVDGSIDGFSESGEGEAADAWLFDIGRQDYKSLRLSLGAQADYAINTDFGVLLPGLRVRYVYEAEDGTDSLGLGLANNPFAESELGSDALALGARALDNEFLDAAVSVSGQFILGISGFVDYHFYDNFRGFSRDGYSVGLRWDKPF